VVGPISIDVENEKTLEKGTDEVVEGVNSDEVVERVNRDEVEVVVVVEMPKVVVETPVVVVEMPNEGELTIEDAVDEAPKLREVTNGLPAGVVLDVVVGASVGAALGI